MKKIIKLLFCFIMIIFISGCDDINNNIDTDFTNKVVEKKYNVKIHIDFPSNIIFSRYDVDMIFDDNKKVLEHGNGGDFEFSVTKGFKSLVFQNDDDSSVKSEEKIEVNSDMEIGYRISCYSDNIKVENLYIDRKVELEDNQVKIDFDSSKFDGKNYKDVISELETLGFTNIEEKPVYDIIFGITEEGTIKSVSIDGKENYRRGDIFNKDAKIIVSYSLKMNDDPTRIKAPYDSSCEKDYTEVVEAYKEAGFTNIKTEAVSTYTKSDDKKIYEIEVGIFSVSLNSTYTPDEEVLIKYYKYAGKTGTSSNKDDYGDSKHHDQAKRAFENMGKSLYPYGIKYHWIVGLRDFTYKGKGVWHISVDVTITNKYNAKREAIATADVNFKKEKVENWKVTNKY